MREKIAEVSIACGVFILAIFFSKHGTPAGTSKTIQTSLGMGVYVGGLIYFFMCMKRNTLFRWPLIIFTALLCSAMAIVLFF